METKKSSNNAKFQGEVTQLGEVTQMKNSWFCKRYNCKNTHLLNFINTSLKFKKQLTAWLLHCSLFTTCGQKAAMTLSHSPNNKQHHSVLTRHIYLFMLHSHPQFVVFLLRHGGNIGLDVNAFHSVFK